MSRTPAGRRLLLAALIAASAPPALSLGLGEAELRSALGEPLDLVISITAAPDESLGADCFQLPRPLPGGLPAVTRAQFTIESGSKLRVRTPQPLNEPAMLLRMHASCPGGGLVAREYPLLLDPRPVSAVVPPAPAKPVEAPRAAQAASASDTGAPRLHAIAGDTLGGIAAAIYPKNRRAREAYVAALRDANPSLAALGPDDPVPLGTAVELPDLRTVAQRTPAKAPAATATAPAEAPARPTKAPREKAATQRDAGSRERSPAPARTREKPRRADGFVLRLSSGEMDLARSKDIDDRTRAQLRERLLLLDSDDQVSALLQLRNSLKQLENRVSEMQLRLSGPLPSAPGVAAPKPNDAAPPATVAPATATPTTAATPAEAKPAEPSPPAATTAPVEPPKAAPPPAPAKPAPAAAPPPEPASPAGIPLQAWGLAAVAAAGLALVAWMILRRRARARADRATEPAYEFATIMPKETPSPAARVHDPDGILPPDEGPPRREAASDADITTRIPGADPQALRRRYLEERFPEIANGSIDIANPDSVVKGARLLYEDGAIPRAVELLQFALEEKPQEMKPWLALFEIFRLENLPGEFGTLAARFKEHHGASDNWRKVQFIGREMDPQNALFRDDSFNSLETIGYPNAAKALAITFDPLAENWLNTPMDFTSDALAADLRRDLLVDAGLTESDLIPNPMPALKQVEMFNVA